MSSKLTSEVERLTKRTPGQGPFGVEGILLLVVNRRIPRGTDLGHIDVEDIVQDTYVDLLSQEGTDKAFDPNKAKLGAFAGTIAFRKANRAALKATRLPLRLGEHQDVAPAAWGNPVQSVVDHEFRDRLGRAWKGLQATLGGRKRLFELKCLRAVVACAGDRTRAARILTRDSGCSVNAEHVKAGLARALSYPEGRDLLALFNEMTKEMP